jgi:uncharacterized alpha-E superfamily protein
MGNLRSKYTDEEWEKLEDFKKTIEENQTDPIVDKVLTKFSTRSKLGITKYGTTLQDNDSTFFEWLNHLQEELMDATLYIEKLKQNIK